MSQQHITIKTTGAGLRVGDRMNIITEDDAVSVAVTHIGDKDGAWSTVAPATLANGATLHLHYQDVVWVQRPLQ